MEKVLTVYTKEGIGISTRADDTTELTDIFFASKENFGD